jgi:ribose 5-phosphate isomerase A
MNQQELKTLVGQAALHYVVPYSVVGVGTGSTVNCFIDALATIKDRIEGAVSSSEQTTQRLKKHGIAVLDSNTLESIPVYIDGADEIDPYGHMIKGGGAALTREKILADLAERFICIADESKRVPVLGAFPLPLEVVPMATAQICRHLSNLGARPVLRETVVTDNGGHIIDAHGLSLRDPVKLEQEINQWPGVISVGIFARHKAHLCLMGTVQGVQVIQFDSMGKA